MNDYLLKESKVINNNCDEIVEEMHRLYEQMSSELSVCQKDDTTLEYRYLLLNKYNIFDFNTYNTYPILEELYIELIELTKTYPPTSGKGFWIRGWVNFDTYDTVETTLNGHLHEYETHGYISINPQGTKTVFIKPNDDMNDEFEIDSTKYHPSMVVTGERFEIENQTGVIYIGPGNYWHKVVNTSEYDGRRITIGYDVAYKQPETYPSREFGVGIWNKIEHDIR